MLTKRQSLTISVSGLSGNRYDDYTHNNAGKARQPALHARYLPRARRKVFLPVVWDEADTGRRSRTIRSATNTRQSQEGLNTQVDFDTARETTTEIV
jgi:hypothetical protein